MSRLPLPRPEFEDYGFRGVVAKPYVVAELSTTLKTAITGAAS